MSKTNVSPNRLVLLRGHSILIELSSVLVELGELTLLFPFVKNVTDKKWWVYSTRTCTADVTKSIPRRMHGGLWLNQGLEVNVDGCCDPS